MITGDDINTIMDLLVSAYGEKAYPLDDPNQMAKMSNLWTVMFEDDSPADVLKAVKNCIATLQFPPKIADIKQRIAKAKLSGQMTDTEAWQMVTKAIEDATGYNDAIEAFSKLPPILQKLVAEPKQLRNWRTIEPKQLETVVMSTFVRSYRELAQREFEYNTLPADIQEQSGWMVEEPVAELPAPKPDRTFSALNENQMLSEIEKQEWEYRINYLLPEVKHFYPDRYYRLLEEIRKNHEDDPSLGPVPFTDADIKEWAD